MSIWVPPHHRKYGQRQTRIKIRSNVITCRSEWRRVLEHAYSRQPLLRMDVPGLWIAHNQKLGQYRADYTDQDGNEYRVGQWNMASHNVQDWARGEVWLPYDYNDHFYDSDHHA